MIKRSDISATVIETVSFIGAESTAFYGVTATMYYPQNFTLNYTASSGSYGGTLTWQETTSGPCGPNAWWSFDSDTNTLQISGVCTIFHRFDGDFLPWAGLDKDILNIQVGNGITYLPEYCFGPLYKVTTCSLPDTLHTIYATAINCSRLNNLMIPPSVKHFVSDHYFPSSGSLTDIYYMGTAADWTRVLNGASVIGNKQNLHLHCLTAIDGRLPTCTETGVATYYQFDNADADACAYPYFYDEDLDTIIRPKVLPALGHDIIIDMGKAPTCTESGLTEGKHCTRCDEETFPQEEIPVLGHAEMTHSAQAPTCEDIGWEAYVTCSRCDYSTFTQLPAIGHNYPEVWTACEDGAYHKKVCANNASHVLTESHTMSQWYATIMPTYTQPGEERRDCVCGAFDGRSLPATGPALVESIVLDYNVNTRELLLENLPADLTVLVITYDNGRMTSASVHSSPTPSISVPIPDVSADNIRVFFLYTGYTPIGVPKNLSI